MFPNALRRMLSRHRARPRARRAGLAPRLTVVMPAYNVENLVAESMRSVLGQTLREIELLVIDDGSTDRTLEVVRKVAEDDERVRFMTQPNAGLSATRNRGVRLARAPYVAFLDSDDLVEPRALELMVTKLEKNHADLAVASYTHFQGSRTIEPGQWIRDLHETARYGIRLTDDPRLLDNAIACSKVFRTSFLIDNKIEFPEGVLYEDQQTTALAYAWASSINVHPFPLLRWRLRADGSSITQQSAQASNLAARAEAVRQTLRILDEEGQSAAYRYRVASYLANNTFTLRHLVRDDDDYWEILREIVTELLDIVEPELFQQLTSPQDRLVYWLVREGRRSEALTVVREGGLDINGAVPFIDKHGAVRYVIPGFDPSDEPIPEMYLGPSERHTRLQSIVTHVELSNYGLLRVVGNAYVPNVPQEQSSPIRAWLENVRTGARHEMRVRQFRDETAQSRTNNQVLDYTNCGFDATIPLDEALSSEPGSPRFRIRVSRTTAGLTRSAAVTKTLPGSSAAQAHATRLTDGRLATARPRKRGLFVEIHDKVAVFRLLAFTASYIDLQVERAQGKTLNVVLTSMDRVYYERKTVVRPPGGWQGARVRLGRPTTTGPFRLEVMRGNGSPLAPWLIDSDESPVLSVEVTRSWGLRLIPRDGVVRLVAADLADDALVLSLQSHDSTELRRLQLTRGSTVISGTLDSQTEDATTHKFRLVDRAREGFTDRAVPRGAYRVRVAGETSRDAPSPVHAALDLHLPLTLRGDRVEVTLRRASSGAIDAHVRPPLPALHRSRRYRRMQEDSVRSYAGPTRPAVYLQCLLGDQVADSQLALAEYLAAEHPDIPVVWGVKDYSQSVPAVQDRVVIGSPEYFEALRTSRWLVFNHEVPRYVTSGPDQVVVQTYHGHPFKAMGLARWRAQSVTPAQIEAALDMRRCWDLLLTQNPTATALYRENFPLDYATAEVGHPRNDRLMASGDDEYHAVRAQLGVPEGKVAVLYAPTYRDTSTTSPWVAPPVDFITPPQLHELLGPNFVVLWRGHPAHLRFAERHGLDLGTLDVSGHPDVNDLIIASDVGLFDYSSIRFDYSVTGKPMVFFAPDEQEYFSTYPPLLPYRETTPGPVVKALPELRDAVHEAAESSTSGARRAHASYEEFVARFNPLDDGRATARLFEAMLDTYTEKTAERHSTQVRR